MEKPDQKDNNCNGVVDEQTSLYDDDGDGFTEPDLDRDDDSADVNPAAIEYCDDLDNNRDGRVDEAGCIEPTSPPVVVGGIQMSKTAIGAGETVTMIVYVHDADEDELEFAWQEDPRPSTAGHTSIASSAQTITWVAPPVDVLPGGEDDNGQIYEVVVLVNDEDDQQSRAFGEIWVYPEAVQTSLDRAVTDTTDERLRRLDDGEAAVGLLFPLVALGGGFAFAVGVARTDAHGVLAGPRLLRGRGRWPRSFAWRPRIPRAGPRPGGPPGAVPAPAAEACERRRHRGVCPEHPPAEPQALPPRRLNGLHLIGGPAALRSDADRSRPRRRRAGFGARRRDEEGDVCREPRQRFRQGARRVHRRRRGATTLGDGGGRDPRPPGAPVPACHRALREHGDDVVHPQLGPHAHRGIEGPPLSTARRSQRGASAAGRTGTPASSSARPSTAPTSRAGATFPSASNRLDRLSGRDAGDPEEVVRGRRVQPHPAPIRREDGNGEAPHAHGRSSRQIRVAIDLTADDRHGGERFDHAVRPVREDAREHEVPAGEPPQIRGHLDQHLRVDVGHHQRPRPGTSASGVSSKVAWSWLRSAFSLEAATASGSMSMPWARIPSRAAASASRPVPQPTSRQASPGWARRCTPSRQRRVVGCSPVPKAIPGSMTRSPSSASHGGATARSPTTIRSMPCFHDSAQSCMATGCAVGASTASSGSTRLRRSRRASAPSPGHHPRSSTRDGSGPAGPVSQGCRGGGASPGR